MEIINSTADMLYRNALRVVIEQGQMTHPRGFDCLELSPCHLTLTDPTSNIVTHPMRKINKAFAAAEFFWIIQGRNDVEFLDPYNSKIKAFSDNGKTFFGAYGPKYVTQLQYVLDTLEEDPWTRQAVMTIWRENPPATKDVPCTVMLHFMRRPVDTLNLIVYMRSQDCWLGLPYDLHNFTCIQILVANTLKLKVGVFDLFQGSLHAYKHDFAKINELIDFKFPLLTETVNTPLDIMQLIAQKQKWMYDYLEQKGTK